MLRSIGIFISVFTVFAATAQKSTVRLGLRAGIYSSRFNFTGYPASYGKPGGDDAFYAGIQAVIPFNKKLSISTEALYATSSVQAYFPPLYQDNLSHLFIPVLFKYSLGKVSLFAGPQAELLLSAKGFYVLQTPEDPNYSYYVLKGDIRDISYKKISVDAVFGLEWIFKYRFGIDARAQYGLVDYRAGRAEVKTGRISAPASKITNYGLQAGLFFRFGKKPK